MLEFEGVMHGEKTGACGSIHGERCPFCQQYTVPALDRKTGSLHAFHYQRGIAAPGARIRYFGKSGHVAIQSVGINPFLIGRADVFAGCIPNGDLLAIRRVAACDIHLSIHSHIELIRIFGNGQCKFQCGLTILAGEFTRPFAR